MIRTTQVTVMKDGGCTFDEENYVITIEDEANGEFVVMRELCDVKDSEIRIDPKEWPELREAIDLMISNCKGE